MTAYTFDETILSDLFKDAYGFRPRENFWNTWKSADNDRKQRIWDELLRSLDFALDEAKAQEAYAIEQYELQLAQILDTGAGDRQTAIRWLVESITDEFDRQYGAGFVCYKLGLPYTMEKEFEGCV